jgi:hypothetical protein
MTVFGMCSFEAQLTVKTLRSHPFSTDRPNDHGESYKCYLEVMERASFGCPLTFVARRTSAVTRGLWM